MKNSSIQNKLTLMGAFIALFTALVVCVPLIFYYVSSEKKSLVDEVKHTGDLIGNIMAPVMQYASNLSVFGKYTIQFEVDKKETRERLSQALKGKPSLVLVCLYTKQQRFYTGYEDNSMRCPISIENFKEARFAKNTLSIYREIYSKKGERVGGVFLVSDMRDLKHHLTLFITFSFLFIIAVLLLTFFIVRQAQKIISGPIEQITHVAQEIRTQHNYNQKVQKVFNDEIGILVDTFNDMVREIKLRDGKLNAINRDLKEKIEEIEQRTLQIEKHKKQLELALSNVKEANKAKSEFLRNMSHEFRTPLHVMNAYSQFGLSDYKTATREKLGENFSKISMVTKRLNGLVESLLSVAQLESGKEIFDIKPHNLVDTVQAVVDEQRPLLEEKGINLILKLPKRIIEAEYDEPKIIQVFVNILGNAIKFTESGKRITISIQKDELGRKYKKAAYRITFSDEGIGIPKGELKKIFEKFTQSSRTNDGSGGTGLGLAIAHKIVLAHGGKIYAEHNKGGGTSFIVLLPKQK